MPEGSESSASPLVDGEDFEIGTSSVGRGVWTILHIGYVGSRCVRRRLPSSLNHRYLKYPFHPQMHSLRDRLHPHDWHWLMKARGTPWRNLFYELALVGMNVGIGDVGLYVNDAVGGG